MILHFSQNKNTNKNKHNGKENFIFNFLYFLYILILFINNWCWLLVGLLIVLLSVKMSSRFVHVSDEDLIEISKKKTTKNTNSATSNAVTTFLAFCQELNIFSINAISKEELKTALTKFYAGCRTERGEFL